MHQLAQALDGDIGGLIDQAVAFYQAQNLKDSTAPDETTH
jgi:hypothetical protein